MAYLCCPSCSLRVQSGASPDGACPSCGHPLELTTAAGALGYRLFEAVDPVPLSATAAAVAVALEALRPTAH
jgi:hypothetical protein